MESMEAGSKEILLIMPRGKRTIPATKTVEKPLQEEVKPKTIPVSALSDRERIAYWELSRLYQIYGDTIMNRVNNIIKGTS